jgi:hypothetical protein
MVRISARKISSDASKKRRQSSSTISKDPRKYGLCAPTISRDERKKERPSALTISRVTRKIVRPCAGTISRDARRWHKCARKNGVHVHAQFPGTPAKWYVPEHA